MSEPRIYIGFPIYGQVGFDFLTSLLHLWKSVPCSFEFELKFMPGDSLIPRSRNTITAAFLRTTCSHLMFIDSDLEFSVEQIKRLLDHDRDVVAGFYPKKKDGELEWVCNALANKPEPCGLQEVRYIGTGFILIKRHVIEEMVLKYAGEIGYISDASGEIEFDLWPVGTYDFHSESGFHYDEKILAKLIKNHIPENVAKRIMRARYLSEDWNFCQRWRDMGGKIYGDTRVILKHTGPASYPLKSQIKFLYPGFRIQEETEVLKQRTDEVAQYDLPFEFTPSTILDIGANIGLFSMRCHNKWPDASIIAYEPMPQIADLFNRNCPSANLTIAAVRSFNGSDFIRIGDMDLLNSFHDLGWQKEEKQRVECVSASEISSCELVKIDTEGCEIEILSHLDLSKTKAMVCEYHRIQDADGIRNIASRNDFYEVQHVPNPANINYGVLKFSRKYLCTEAKR